MTRELVLFISFKSYLRDLPKGLKIGIPYKQEHNGKLKKASTKIVDLFKAENSYIIILYCKHLNITIVKTNNIARLQTGFQNC